MATFIGFWSPERGPVQVLYDMELVKQDLLNHFMTQKGERVMDADYGFIAWDLIFELKNAGVKDRIEQDARRIVATEPRVQEREITFVEEEHGFTVNILLYFVALNTVGELSIFFDNRNFDAQQSIHA